METAENKELQTPKKSVNDKNSPKAQKEFSESEEFYLLESRKLIKQVELFT